MSDLKRLIADKPTDLESMLLAAVRNEQPSAAHRANLQQALGISATPAGAASIGGAAIAKISLVALVAAGALGALVMNRSSGHSPEPLILAPPTAAPIAPPPVGAAPVAPTGPSPAPLALNVEGAPPSSQRLALAPSVKTLAPSSRTASSLPTNKGAAAVALSPTPSSTELAAGSTLPATPLIAPSPATVNTPAPVTTTTQPSDVREQIGMIDSARAALAKHDPRDALAWLDRYTSRFPNGTFRPEASVLRIEALEQKGDHAGATSLARSFLADNPKSTHVERVERVTGR